MKTLYVEGSGLFHRMPVGLKLALLTGAGLLLFLTRDPRLVAIGPIVGALAYFSLGQPWREALARLKPVFLTILIVAAFSFLVNSGLEALLQLLRLTALMLFGATVTATTTISAFMDTITRLAKPMERTGLVRADDIGLSFGLVVRFVPEILLRYEAIRDAHKARGVPFRIHTALVPLVILTLKDADQIAAAIDARGLRRH